MRNRTAISSIIIKSGRLARSAGGVFVVSGRSAGGVMGAALDVRRDNIIGGPPPGNPFDPVGHSHRAKLAAAATAPAQAEGWHHGVIRPVNESADGHFE
jgi:hypothetical protein